jgi:hypothetical protein
MPKCKSCQAEIVFLVTKKGKQMPVTASSLTQEDRELIGIGSVVEYRHGQHISHFSDCKDASLFRK